MKQPASVLLSRNKQVYFYLYSCVHKGCISPRLSIQDLLNYRKQKTEYETLTAQRVYTLVLGFFKAVTHHILVTAYLSSLLIWSPNPTVLTMVNFRWTLLS